MFFYSPYCYRCFFISAPFLLRWLFFVTRHRYLINSYLIVYLYPILATFILWRFQTSLFVFQLCFHVTPLLKSDLCLDLWWIFPGWFLPLPCPTFSWASNKHFFFYGIVFASSLKFWTLSLPVPAPGFVFSPPIYPSTSPAALIIFRSTSNPALPIEIFNVKWKRHFCRNVHLGISVRKKTSLGISHISIPITGWEYYLSRSFVTRLDLKAN